MAAGPSSSGRAVFPARQAPGVGVISIVIVVGVTGVLAVIGLGYRLRRRRRQQEGDQKPEPTDGSDAATDGNKTTATSRLTGNRHTGHGTPRKLDLENGWVLAETPELITDVDECDTDLGRLTYTVGFDGEKDALLVTIVKCTDLPAESPEVGSTDHYVKLQLLPEKKHKVKTRVLRKSISPSYEETFSFYGIKEDQLASIALHFVILSFDRFSRDDVIGEVLFPLCEAEIGTRKTVTLERSIVKRNMRQKSHDRGEIHISVCHQPMANRLTVVVLKATNLPKMDITGLAGDPYVKVYLLRNGQRIAKKKTHVKKQCFHPTFNETFVFDIASEEDVEKMGLEVMVLDWDRVVKNELIGRVNVGMGNSRLAETHWQKVIKNPRRQIAECYRLTL